MMSFVRYGLTRSSSVLSSAKPIGLREILGASFSSSHNVQMTDGGVPVGVRILALNDLRDNAGARKKRKRVGRGIGSGRGKTSGKGMNGQKPRRSNIGPGFQGGQSKLIKRIPKRGFSNGRFRRTLDELNFCKLQQFIDTGRIDPSKTITMKHLFDCRIVGKIKHGVKLLSKGADRLSQPITIEVTRASKSAIDVVEAAGGRVTTVYYNRLGLRALLKPHSFEGPLPRRARPKPKDMPYYTSFANRGYLSPEMQLSTAQFVEQGFPNDPKEVRKLLHPSTSTEELD